MRRKAHAVVRTDHYRSMGAIARWRRDARMNQAAPIERLAAVEKSGDSMKESGFSGEVLAGGMSRRPRTGERIREAV